MALEFKTVQDVLIITIDGRLDSLNASDVYKQIEEKLKEHSGDVIFNFENLEYISSAGLQVLLMCAKNRQSIGKKTYVYKPRDIVEEVLNVSGFYSFIGKADKLPES